MRKWLFALLALSSISAFCAVTGTDLSLQRVDNIQTLFDHLILAYQNGEATTQKLAPKLLAMMAGLDPALGNFNEATPLRSEKNADEDAEATVSSRLNEIYPLFTEEQLFQAGEESYPLYKRNDRVKIVFKNGPEKIEVLTGYFQSFQSGYVRISNRNIAVRDMRGLKYEDIDNDYELIKFDPELNAKTREELRQVMIDERAAQREDWLNKNQDDIYLEQGTIEGKINEENGYTFYENTWLTPKEFVYTFTGNALAKRASVAASFARTRAEEQTLIANSRLVAAQIANSQVPPYKAPSLERMKIAKAEADKQAALEAEQAAAKEAEQAESAAKNHSHRQDTLMQDDIAAELHNSKLPLYLGIIAIIVLGVGVVALIIKRKKDEEELDVSAFFEGKGTIQKNFWDMANADSKFYYVAYLFPAEDLAQDALTKLSFMEVDASGNITTNRDIMFGTYEHAQGAVCYIGGKKLNYALWREASAVWPELPLAQYFKVSKEPMVQLIIPGLTSADEIQDLGQEDIRNEDGSFTRLFKFRVDSREKALEFIEQFEINEEGISVNVEAPGIRYGRDINGFYEMQD